MAQVFSNLCRAGRLEDALQVAEAAVKARRDDILIRCAWGCARAAQRAGREHCREPHIWSVGGKHQTWAVGAVAHCGELHM